MIVCIDKHRRRFINECFDMTIFFFEQKTAYEMRISDWSSDVCSSDLRVRSKVCWRLGAGCKRLSHLSWSSRPFVRRGLSPLDNFEFRPGRKCCPALFFSEPIHLEADRKSTRLNSSH